MYDGNARKVAEFLHFQGILVCEFNEIEVNSEFSGSATSMNTVDVDLVDNTPASKKLKLLADTNADQSTVSQSAESPDSHHNHQFLIKISTYLGPLKLTNEELLSPLISLLETSHGYKLARMYLTPNVSSIPVESLFHYGNDKKRKTSKPCSIQAAQISFCAR